MVNYSAKNEGFSQGFKEGFTEGFMFNKTQNDDETKTLPAAYCESSSKKFDTWSIYCDTNKNGKWDHGEKKKTFRFRATQKKAQQANMKLKCDK